MIPCTKRKELPVPFNCKRFKNAIGLDLSGKAANENFLHLPSPTSTKISRWNFFFFFFLLFFCVSAWFPYFLVRVAVGRAIAFSGNHFQRKAHCNKFYRRLTFKLRARLLPLLNGMYFIYILYILKYKLEIILVSKISNVRSNLRVITCKQIHTHDQLVS